MTQPVSHHSCEYCGDGTPQQSTVWRKIVCCDDGTHQEVWCCDECYDDPSIEVLQEEEGEEIIDLCDE